MTPKSAPTRLRYWLFAIFVLIGVVHFVVPHPFERIVPSWVPDARMAVILSGIAEIAGGVGLLIPVTRRLAGWCLIALLVAVFPANIHMLQLARNAHESALNIAILWIRLPFQPLLIWLLWKAAVRNPDRNH